MARPRTRMDKGPRVKDGLLTGRVAEERAWVGESLRWWRDYRGLRQADIADLLASEFGLPWDQRTVASIEAGKRSVSLVEVMLLCVALQTSVKQFLLQEHDTSETSQPPLFVTGVKLPGRGEVVNTYFLTRVLHKALTANDGAVMDVLPDEDEVDLSGVIQRVSAMLEDPDLEALQEFTHVTDADRLRELVRKAYTEATGSRASSKTVTATRLVDLFEQELNADGEPETEKGRRVVRHYARARAADLIIEIAMRNSK